MVTLTTRLGILAYLISQMSSVFTYKYVMQNSSYRRDFNTDSTVYHLDNNNFNYGIRLEYIFFAREPDV